MVGSVVLNHCLSSSGIEQVTSLTRKISGNNHPKLSEVLIRNFSDYSEQVELFKGIDMAFFCIGVYTGQVANNKFKEITVDYAVAFAKKIKENSPNATLCLLSGAGADRTEKSRVSFALYKGMAENQISVLGLNFHVFRPGYIYPVVARKEPNFMYKLSRFLYPVFKMIGKKYSIKSTELGLAMFNVGMNGAGKEILENEDILEYLD